MPIDKTTIISHLNSVLAAYSSLVSAHSTGPLGRIERPPVKEASEIATRLHAAIQCYAPPSSTYRNMYVMMNDRSWATLDTLAGTVSALANDYQIGMVFSFREMIRTDLFSDFLEMAESFLEQGLKDPAAGLIGAVLEKHLRDLAVKNSVDTTFVDGKGNAQPKKLDTLNADLVKAGVYTSNQQKQVTAWAALRNNAAHGDFGKYILDEVKLMAQGVRMLVGNYSA